MKKRLIGIILSAALIIGNIAPAFALPAEKLPESEKIEIVHPVGDILREEAELSDEEIDRYFETHTPENEEETGSAQYNEKWDKYANYYYYNQMSDKQRKVWDFWTNECNAYLYGSKKNSNIDTQTIGSGHYFAFCQAESGAFDSYRDMINFYYIFRYSNPQFYFLRSGCAGNESRMSVGPMVYSSFVSGTSRSQATAKMDAAIQEYYREAGSAQGEALIRKLHDLEAEKVEYNHESVRTMHVNEESEYTQSSYSALVLKAPVCAGYTMAFELLCNGKDIECCGVTSENHAWNKVWTDGAWYNIDVTWDDRDRDTINDTVYEVYYEYYLKSTARYRDISDVYYASHIEEAYLNPYLPTCTRNSSASSLKYGSIPEASGTMAKPVISISNGKATITGAGSDRIYYSVNDDGTNPSAASTKSKIYSSSFGVEQGDKIKAIAVRDGYNNSAVAVKTFGGATVTYNLGGGTNNSGNPTMYDPDEGGSFTLLSPTRRGYEFRGWYTNGSFDEGSRITTLDLTNEEGYELYAKWEAKSMTVTLDANGGAFSDESETKQKSVRFAAAYGDLDIPVKSGSAFLGWSKVKNGTSYITRTSIVDEDGDHTLYACWERKKYTVRYMPNGGSGTMSDVIAYCDEDITISPCRYTRKGYGFKEWNTEADGSGNAYEPGSVVPALSSVGGSVTTLYAIWDAAEYTVTLDADGGHFDGGELTATAKVKYGMKYGALPVPERTGYAFDCWTRTRGSRLPITEDTIVNLDSDHTLYACWDINKYTVRYMANNGTDSSYENTVPYDESFAVRACGFINSGYQFKEWNTEPDGSGDSYEAGERVSGLCEEDGAVFTLYAIWEEKAYTLTLNANGGIFSSGNVTSRMDVKFGQEIGELPSDVTREGYEFAGWFTDRECNEPITGTTAYEVSGDSVIYAGWTANTYSVIFDANGGELVDEEMLIVEYDSPYGELPTPERSGYIFTGWYTDADGGSKVTSRTIVKQTESITLYAHWKIVDEDIVIAKQKVDIRDRFTVSANIVKYKVSSTKLASVTRSGVLTAKKAGTVEVTGYSKEDGVYIPAETISVDIEKPVFKFTEYAVTPGQEIDANEFITGTDVVPDKWTLSSTKYADIDEDGNILISDNMKSGTVKVTAWYSTELNTAKYTAVLKVKIPKLSFAKATIKEGYTKKLKVKNLLGADVEYSSDDEDVATIDAYGVIKPEGVGTTTINALINDYNYTCEVTVIHNIRKMKLVADTTVLSLDEGDIGFIDVITTPDFDDVNADTVEWKSSNSSIATVENGVVTPNRKGKVKITAKAMGKTASITIKVVN